MYLKILASHNILRWLILMGFALILIRSLSGWIRSSVWTKSDEFWLKITVIFMDIQLLIGLILYFFFSPVTQKAFQNMKAAMKDSTLRHFAVEHILLMIVAVVLAHFVKILARRKSADARKHRFILLSFLLISLVILAGMPWFRPFIPRF
ncbi:MAG: hypothetical protein H7A25_00350 [Leptospiraceae bacterium]|nr:hypothetical protein [Leptospiraceae bacterium]MCP5498326.1 hypothetical protein [Leptospiraceae bacterium]